MKSKFVTLVQERWLVGPTLMVDTVEGRMRTLGTQTALWQVLTNEDGDYTLHKRWIALNARGHVDRRLRQSDLVSAPILHLYPVAVVATFSQTKQITVKRFLSSWHFSTNNYWNSRKTLEPIYHEPRSRPIPEYSITLSSMVLFYNK